MSTNATLGNAKHLLTVADQKNLSKEGCDALVQTGLLADLIEAAEAGKLAEISREAFREMIGIKEEILRLISVVESIILDPTDSKATLAGAKELFPGCLDLDFHNWRTDKPGTSTEKTLVQVYELVKDATFQQMFGSLGTDLDKLCLTQAQIIQFVKQHESWLHPDGYATFFLFKVDTEFFVARVNRHGGKLEARVYRLSHGYVWNAERRHRGVIPQLAL